MDTFEEAVLAYISAVGGRFVSSQFSIEYENGIGGSCPDFVVLDFTRETVYVVEVTSASNPSGILSRIAEKDSRWLTPLRQRLPQAHAPLSDWRYRVTVFVRGEILDALRGKVADSTDVSILSLDDVVFPWRWQWKGQKACNPLE